jgi:catechol 2,3-dioxygenase-like lactoylglutathione lyase family enzyme
MLDLDPNRAKEPGPWNNKLVIGLPSAKASAETSAEQRRSAVASVSFGKNMKISARSSDRDRMQKFYGEVLGCEVFKQKGVDFVRFSNDFYMCVVYDDDTLPNADALKAIWLEVRTARPAEMKEKILAFGVKEVEHWDKQHFYFQAPNGQVFRLATNDMVDGWGLKK